MLRPPAKTALRSAVCLYPATTLLIALTGGLLWRETAGPRRPQTLEDVAALAAPLGLRCSGNTRDGAVVGCLLVSDAPLTWEHRAGLRLEQPDHPCWAGVVAVYTGGPSLLPSHVPGRSLLWGDLFVFGDVGLIRRLAGLDPTGQR